jgi:hypothetical protein
MEEIFQYGWNYSLTGFSMDELFEVLEQEIDFVDSWFG